MAHSSQPPLPAAGSNRYLPTDYSLALVTWQNSHCSECNEPLDMRGISVVEACGDCRNFYHFYCYRSLPGIKIESTWIYHIDRDVSPSKITDFIRRQHYLVDQRCRFDIRKHYPSRSASACLSVPLVEAFKFLPARYLLLTLPLVSSHWYEQSLRDELWLSVLDQFYPQQALTRQCAEEPLKVVFLRALKEMCKECRQPLATVSMRCPFSPQYLCKRCAGLEYYALLTKKKVHRSYYISYTGIIEAGVVPVANIHGVVLVFAGQAHHAILSFRQKRKVELEMYLMGKGVGSNRLAQLRLLDITSHFPRFANQFERKMQGYIYCWSKQANFPLSDYLLGFTLF